MKKLALHILKLAALSLFFICQLSAQPGGGGGLVIKNLYNRELQAVDPLTNPDLQVRTFVLNKGSIYQETFLNEGHLASGFEIGRRFFVPGGIGLEPVHDEEGYYVDPSDQRVVLIYRNDTMIVDFIGIIGGNGMGLVDVIDSLVIQPGYFKYDRNPFHEGFYNYQYYEDFIQVRELLSLGLTFHTIDRLSEEGLLEFDPHIDLSFLLEENLPSSYFLKRAWYHYLHDRFDQALSDVEKAIEKNHGEITCEARLVFVNVYEEMGQYDLAIEYMSNSIKCAGQNRWTPDEMLEHFFRRRAQLFTKANRLEEALKDYNSLAEVSSAGIWGKIERAKFKMEHLGDFQSAIDDLQGIIDQIPDNHLQDRPFGTSEYADVYLCLAQAEYGKGDSLAAFGHWLRAEELGNWDRIVFFDSLIGKHPGVPELYLARALAHRMKREFDLAINDLEEAARCGFADYRIHFYRASILQLMKKYDEALSEINIAIQWNPDDPRSYLVRYQLRNKLGQSKGNDPLDPDLQKYHQLCEKWVFIK